MFILILNILYDLQSTKFHEILYDLEWFNWNIKNRKALLIMMINSSTPTTMSVYGLFDVNRILGFRVRYLYNIYFTFNKDKCLGNLKIPNL